MNASTSNHADFEFSYADRLGRQATHRIRLFTPGSWTTVLITDLSEQHRCPSVTNSIEELVDALLQRHSEIRPARMIVIEHYDDRPLQIAAAARIPIRPPRETFDLVSFLTSQDGKLCEPNWKRVTKEEAELWTGSPLP